MATQLTSAGIQGHEVVSPNEWIASRKELLRKEKEFTKLRDELSRQRRELPWEKVEKQYVFDGPNGKETLADLFDGKSQLIVYHFMFGPGWDEGCPSCSFLADHFDGSLVHLANRDVTLVVVSRAPLAQIEAFKKRMGWRFKWVSSFGNDFNRDYHVSFTKEEMAKGKVPYNYDMVEFGSEEGPGASVFYKNASGDVFHTYSAYARGLDILVGAYNFLDLAPKGRDEDGLAFSMAWVRHHDKYAQGYVVDPKAQYVAPEGLGIVMLFGGAPLVIAHRSLLRWCLNLFQPHGGGGAGRYRRSARADIGEALPRPCGVDSSERHPGPIAKVPSMSDCVLCDWNRNRNFNVNRDLPADGAGGAVRGIAVVFSSQPRTPLHRAAREIALRTMQYRASARPKPVGSRGELSACPRKRMREKR